MQTDPTTGLTCSACGADNPSGADFCWQCFAPFHRAAPTRPGAPPAPGPSWMSARPPVDGPPVKKRRSYRAAIVVAVLIVGGIAFGSASRTHFTIPESIDGVPRMHDATSQRFEAAVAKWGQESDGLSLQGAAYGSGVSPEFAIGAADDPVRNDPDDILRLVVASLMPGGQDTASLSGADGSFEYRCVQASGQVSICVWKEPDNSGFVAADGRSPADTLTLTRAVRDAVES
jgi:hypothetical protein